MTENRIDIHAISTKRTDLQTDRVLLFGQVKGNKEKANHSNFLKFLQLNRTNGVFGFIRC